MGIVAYLSWQFVVGGNDAICRRKVASAGLGGILLGGIGASLAFMGSAMLMPNSNLGPMVAFLIIGPIGFVAGVLLGPFVALAENFDERAPSVSMTKQDQT